MKKDKSKCLVVLSGGLDSTVCLYIAKKIYSHVETITFDYSQRHKIEIQKAKSLTKELDISNTIIKIPKNIFLGSSLVDLEKKVPINGVKPGIPNTYVPGRNLLFLSYAVSYAESRDIKNIFIGVNALDFSGYPDCRPDFIASFEETANLATGNANKKKIKIITPLMEMSKMQIVLLGKHLKVPFGKTHSCYSPIQKKPCGQCDSCRLRAKGFSEANTKDE
jgi:7-cyano-7-deazaguanine synthase